MLLTQWSEQLSDEVNYVFLRQDVDFSVRQLCLSKMVIVNDDVNIFLQ